MIDKPATFYMVYAEGGSPLGHGTQVVAVQIPRQLVLQRLLQITVTY